MDTTLTRQMMDACLTAEKIQQMLPKLPAGVTPLYIHIVDALHEMEENGERTRVSDLAERLHLSLPGATRPLRALKDLGAVTKETAEDDRRSVSIHLTPLGNAWYEQYVASFHRKLAGIFSGISDEDARTMVRVVDTMYCRMRENGYGAGSSSSKER
ncbi:MAG: MarR family transcriptional regulator [Lachnospiraceae bacterium]|jgi:DNA-binding MarR family transcriptional regulator